MCLPPERKCIMEANHTQQAAPVPAGTAPVTEAPAAGPASSPAEQPRQEDTARRSRAASQQLQRWIREAEDLHSRYPDADLRTELTDSGFRSLLRSGVGVRQAYELQHLEEIKTAAARAAAQAAAEQLSARIRSGGSRPRENGLSGRSAAVTGSSVYSLTAADRREIARRVQRGDRIRF